MKTPVLWSIALAVAAAAPVPRQEVQQPVFRSGTQVVTIDVSVRRRQAPVNGLVAADFELLDNGVRQRIELQPVEAVPVDVTVVFDETRPSQTSIARHFNDDLAKIASLLRPVDRLSVITFDRDVRATMRMQPPSAWKASGLPDLDPSATAVRSAAHIGRQGRAGLDFNHDPRLRYHALSDALLLAMARPAELGRRHLVVAFVIDIDTGSLSLMNLLGPIASRSDALIQIAIWNRRHLFSVYGAEIQFTRRELAAVADATGGEVRDADDRVKAFERIFSEFRSRYLLRYTATGVALGGWHTVAVTLPRFPEYTVHARRGYWGR